MVRLDDKFPKAIMLPPEAASKIAMATMVPWSPPEAAGNEMAVVFEIDPEAADPILLSI